MTPHLFYSEGSDTIRQAPQNYLIAHRLNGRWTVDPDFPADQQLAAKTLKALFNYENRYQSSGDHLVQRINEIE